MGLGILFGLLLLTRGSLVFAIPVMIVLSPHRRPFVVGMLVVLMPWIARNAIEMKAFIPLSTGGGQVLLGANNDLMYAAARDGLPVAEWVDPSTYLPEWETIWELGEIGQDKAATRAAIEYAGKQSPDLLFNVLRARVANFFGRLDPLETMLPVYVFLIGVLVALVDRWKSTKHK
jgi:hypothetical protein